MNPALDLTSMDSSDWMDMISQLGASSSGSSSGGVWVYGNGEGQVSLFTKESVPDSFQPLTAEKISQITDDKLSVSSDSEQTERAAHLMDRIKMLEPDYCVKTDKVASIISGKLSREEQLINGVISAQTLIASTGDTAEGVYFALSSEGRVVVKPTTREERAVSADIFLESMGMTTAKTVEVDLNSTKGKELLAALKKFSSSKESLRGIQDKVDGDRLRVFVMDCLSSTRFSDLDLIQMEGVLSDPQAMMDLGEILFLDVFTHNPDRMSFLGANTGNFMLLETPEDTSRPFHIQLIDSDFDFTHDDEHDQIMEMLIVGEYCDEVADLLIERLARDLGPDSSEAHLDVDKAVLIANMKKGINQAAQRLLVAYQADSAVDAFATKVEASSSEKPDVVEFKSRLQLVKTLLAKQGSM